MEHRLAIEFPRGTVFSLLKAAWEPLWNPKLEQTLRRMDEDTYDNPETIGACTYVTKDGEDLVGMFSFDLRNRPASGEIGFNCTHPAFRRKGYGSAQIRMRAVFLC
jgi:predicted acetyltransferase